MKINQGENCFKTPEPKALIIFKLASNIKFISFKINAEKIKYLLCASHFI